MATVTKDMLISEILEIDRAVAPILMKSGMSCMGCPMAKSETLEQACEAHDADVNAIVEEINKHLAG